MLKTKFKKKIMNILKFKKCIVYRNKQNNVKFFNKSVLKNKRLQNMVRILTVLRKLNVFSGRLRRVCLVTGKFRSIHKTLYFKRHTLKSAMTLNNVPGIKKIA